MPEPDFVRTTRTSYDAVATEYAEHFRDELASRSWDRALLAGFAELVQASSAKPVADVGCGFGRVTAHLHDLGLSLFGVDLSPRMVAVARQKVLTPGGHLLLAFQVGDEPLHLVEAFGHAISLDFHRRHPDHVAELCRRTVESGRAGRARKNAARARG